MLVFVVVGGGGECVAFVFVVVGGGGSGECVAIVFVVVVVVVVVFVALCVNWALRGRPPFVCDAVLCPAAGLALC